MFQYLFGSIGDCYFDLMAKANNDSSKCYGKLSKHTRVILNEFLIARLCGNIETRLRLDVHESLQLLQIENIDPFDSCTTSHTNSIPVGSVYRLLAIRLIPSLQLDSTEMCSTNHYMSVRDHVRKYLNQMFYNLTTISMRDWRTYGQMRIMAKKKFHLETVEDQLPTQTLEQGLDALEIMRNIHLFVSNYVYNLNNQIFIEKDSKNKHLNTINIRHIANSLRTHGIGIINTTVNIRN